MSNLGYFIDVYPLIGYIIVGLCSLFALMIYLSRDGIAIEGNTFNAVFHTGLLVLFYNGMTVDIISAKIFTVVVVFIGVHLGIRTPEGEACDKELYASWDEPDTETSPFDLLEDPHEME